jgi:hypothetical protein
MLPFNNPYSKTSISLNSIVSSLPLHYNKLVFASSIHPGEFIKWGWGSAIEIIEPEVSYTMVVAPLEVEVFNEH